MSANNTKHGDSILDRPPLCCIDLDNKTIDTLQESSYQVTKGSLGPKLMIKRNLSYDSRLQIFFKSTIPKNIHEFNVVIVDLNNITYKRSDDSSYLRSEQADDSSEYFVSSEPANIFDVRPISASYLNSSLHDNSPRIIIAFTSPKYEVNYNFFSSKKRRHNNSILQNYPLIPSCYLFDEKEGNKVSIPIGNEFSKLIFNKYLKKLHYNQTFKTYGDEKDQFYIQSLLINKTKDNVSVMMKNNSSFVFFVPQLKEKGAFILNFLTNVAPIVIPDLFPNTTNNHWKKDVAYFLPNHLDFLNKKIALQAEYDKSLEGVAEEINKNNDTFSFLTDMLTESGDELVQAVIKFFKWLEFPNVLDADKHKEGEENEEDIVINLDKSKLLIECKGIGGTSKDSECSQIDKIVLRRIRETDPKNIFGLYIVNHQKHLPPLNRDNPPFKPKQIKDAKYNKRGMITTWQLFNLFFNIENNLITKKEARDELLEDGLIKFKYTNLISIGKVPKTYKKNDVYSTTLNGTIISKGDTLFYQVGYKHQKCIIESMQQDHTDVTSAENDKVGIKFMPKDLQELKEGTELFKLNK